MAEGTPVRLGVSYFGNRYPSHAREDLRAIAETGAGFVVHAVSEADLRWNPETIAELVHIGREFGLQPWLSPWALGGVFGGESASYAVGEHPEACQRASDGRHLPALCPRQAVFRELMEHWTDMAANVGAEVVQWDEPHLLLPYRRGAEPWACRCGACQEAYQARYGAAMPEMATPQVEAFLDDLMFETLSWLADTAQRRGLQSSVVLLADASYTPDFWRAAASLPDVGYFGTTAFWYFYGIAPSDLETYIALWAARTVEATAGTDASGMGWVQAFGVPAGREGEIERVVPMLEKAGVDTIAVWSYLACAAMSGLAADDPAAAWEAVRRAFAQIKSPRSARG
jgi:hypothetical protein